jgi:WD40 repeat protein
MLPLENSDIRIELSVLIAHQIRETNPDVYSAFVQLCQAHWLLPKGSRSMDDAVDTRVRHLAPDQFLKFLKTLTHADDYPSLFRRMSASSEDPVSLTNRSTLTFLGSLRAQTESVFDRVFDPLSQFLVSGSDDNTVKLFSLPDFAELCGFLGHENTIVSLSIHPNVCYLPSASHDMTLRLWSLNTGKCVSVVENFTEKEAHWATFSPNASC